MAWASGHANRYCWDAANGITRNSATLRDYIRFHNGTQAWQRVSSSGRTSSTTCASIHSSPGGGCGCIGREGQTIQLYRHRWAAISFGRSRAFVIRLAVARGRVLPVYTSCGHSCSTAWRPNSRGRTAHWAPMGKPENCFGARTVTCLGPRNTR